MAEFDIQKTASAWLTWKHLCLLHLIIKAVHCNRLHSACIQAIYLVAKLMYKSTRHFLNLKCWWIKVHLASQKLLFTCQNFKCITGVSFQTAVALDVKNPKNIKLHRWMHIVRFVMILWVVPNCTGIHYYLHLSFLKVEEPQNPILRTRKLFNNINHYLHIASWIIRKYLLIKKSQRTSCCVLYMLYSH